jgi:hypothetical protein
MDLVLPVAGFRENRYDGFQRWTTLFGAAQLDQFNGYLF